MNYCSHCGSAELVLQIPEGDNRPRYCCTNCETIHYQNPKMVVGCLTVHKGKILLCRRAIEPRMGYWNLPAGYLENGESLQGGALRETEEEAGVQASITQLHAVYNIPRINQVYFFFLASVENEQLGGGPESLEVAWFAPEDIPYEEMAFPSSTFAIRQYLSHLSIGFSGVHVGNWEG